MLKKKSKMATTVAVFIAKNCPHIMRWLNTTLA